MPTAIQWTDETFNSWVGCEKVSPACAHCYAEGQARRFNGTGLWGPGHRFKFQSDSYWAQPLAWARTKPAKLGRRPRVFCASMADVFEERPELDEHRDRLFQLVNDTAELDWQILTKRPEFARDYLIDFFHGELPPNIWLGVSIENARYTWRADVLREIPAAVRFISAEPLLGSLFTDGCPSGPRERVANPSRRSRGVVGSNPTPSASEIVSADKRGVATASSSEAAGGGPIEVGGAPRSRKPLDLTAIDWVITGGESGRKARPTHLEHVYEIVQACRDHGVAPFVKQLGAHPIAPAETMPATFTGSIAGQPTTSRLAAATVPAHPLRLHDRKGGDWDEWPADLRIREFPKSAVAA